MFMKIEVEIDHNSKEITKEKNYHDCTVNEKKI